MCCTLDADDTPAILFPLSGADCFQERLVVQIFDRKLGLFLTLLQFFGYASYAFLQRMLHHHRERKIPLTYYVFLGLLQVRRLLPCLLIRNLLEAISSPDICYFTFRFCTRRFAKGVRFLLSFHNDNLRLNA